MTTIEMHNINVPIIKNCRVDYKQGRNGCISFLVDYLNENVIYSENGKVSLKQLHVNFRYKINNNLKISTWNELNVPIYKLSDKISYINY